MLDVFDPTLLVAVTLALFGILFGAAQPRLHQAADWTHDGGGRGIRDQAPWPSSSSACTSPGVSSAASVRSSGRSRAIRCGRASSPSDQPETASYARWAAMLADLDDGRHVPAPAVPRARRAESARARRRTRWRGPFRSICSSSISSSSPSRSRGFSSFPSRGRRRTASSCACPCYFDNRLMSVVVFLGGFRGHGHDRRRVARPLEDDHQRHHPAHAPAPPADGGCLLGHPLLHARGHAGRGGARLRVGADGARTAPPRRDGPLVVRRSEPVRAGHPARAVLAARQSAGRRGGDLCRVRPVVLHARPSPPSVKEGVVSPSVLAEGPWGIRLAESHRPPRPRPVSTRPPTGSSGRSSSTSPSSCSCRSSPSRTPTTAPRPRPSWAQRARNGSPRALPPSCPPPRSSGSCITTWATRKRR